MIKNKQGFNTMENLNAIGLDTKKAKELAAKLNVLLANYSIFYQNTRGYHWNIKGEKFFELHLKFEELYTDSQEKIDLIAERILTLGGKPLHTFEDYSKLAKVNIGKDISNDVEGVRLVVNSISELLKIEREILDKAADATDEGTNSMMSDFIAEQEKTSCMLNAWLN